MDSQVHLEPFLLLDPSDLVDLAPESYSVDYVNMWKCLLYLCRL